MIIFHPRRYRNTNISKISVASSGAYLPAPPAPAETKYYYPASLALLVARFKAPQNHQGAAPRENSCGDDGKQEARKVISKCAVPRESGSCSSWLKSDLGDSTRRARDSQGEVIACEGGRGANLRERRSRVFSEDGKTLG